MPLNLYNTLTRKKDTFKPIKEGQVRLYSCGPTVYDFAHIGNFRAYICSDILKRYLEYEGFRVKHVMNITDVDDKTIRDSQKEGIPLKKFTERYTTSFFDDIKMLNIEPADIFPKATEHIDEMVTLIKNLIKKSIAYKSADGSYYYDISKFKDYGKLAHTKIKSLKSGARISQDEYEKEQAQDFALWKAWDEKDGDVFWETELGKGRPGWHIECSAMSIKYLGNHFDIHTGGVDLIFPHHSNEIAQSQESSGEKFVNYWFHNEYILVDGKKMSKSLGNFYTLRDLLAKGYKPMAIRYLLLSTHYRQQLNFTLEGINAASNSLERLNNFIFNLNSITSTGDNEKVGLLVEQAKLKFEKKMDDDLNISEALAVIFNLTNEINKLIISRSDAKKVIDMMRQFDKVIGVLEFKKQETPPAEIQNLVDLREQARKDKNYSLADKIRGELKEKGYLIEDTKGGVSVKNI